MSLKFIFITLLVGWVSGETISTLEECLAIADSFFCNLNNESTKPGEQGYGYCCDKGSTSVNCNPAESEQL